jgi:broad specificity phosphatase PhoE
MPKQHIFFVRYGLTKYPLVEDMGPYDSPLHPIDGYEHGVAIARRIAGMSTPPDIVYSSSLHRAVSTSQMIVHALGKTENSIRVEDGLIEWLTPSVGLFTLFDALCVLFCLTSLSFSELNFSSRSSPTELALIHVLCSN